MRPSTSLWLVAPQPAYPVTVSLKIRSGSGPRSASNHLFCTVLATFYWHTTRAEGCCVGSRLLQTARGGDDARELLNCM